MSPALDCNPGIWGSSSVIITGQQGAQLLTPLLLLTGKPIVSLDSPAVLRWEGFIYPAFLMPGDKIISFPQCWNLGFFSHGERAEFLTTICSSMLSASQEKQWFTQKCQEQSLGWNQRVPSQLRDSQIPCFLKCCLGGSLWDCEAVYVSVQQNTVTKNCLVTDTEGAECCRTYPWGCPMFGDT